jgi:hypothetical protein
MSTLTPLELIEKQQEVIEQYKLVVEAHNNSRDKLYNFLGTLLTTLKLDDPTAKDLVIKHLSSLLEGRK